MSDLCGFKALMWAFLDWVGKANILLQVNENQL
jgi:hypothetical protein